MLVKLLGRVPLRQFFAVIVFMALCVVFYFALLTSLEENKAHPIRKQQRKMSAEEKRLKSLTDRSMVWAELSRRDKMQRLLENPIYENFNIKKPRVKKKVTVLIIVSSGPRRADRREAIRSTWWAQCKPTFKMIPECVFFTDKQKPGDEYYDLIKNENQIHKDMYFQPLRGGIEFGIRFLYHMVWAMTHYEFDYFVRVDDDYFFCLERFLYELPQPMISNFHWGYTHCILEIVRPEESLILMSRDLMEYFLSQKPHTMRCHPWADQMIGVWTTDLILNDFVFRHDRRVHHKPIVSEKPQLRNTQNVCHKYIGIHGTYPDDMRLFWKQKGKGFNFSSVKERDESIGNLESNSELCELVHNFNYFVFEPEWQYEPKRCIYNPIWDTRKQLVKGGVYAGRQDDKRLALDDVKRKKKENEK